ncbi:MAG: NADP-dependent oxidoreductase [Actinomycetia bacterium]|nr:NADP-dependent oxidoreductase [Actinomycetes bacterium]
MSDSRRVIVSHLPEGRLDASDFTIESVPVPEPSPGKVVVEVSAITIGAGQRAGLQGSASYAGAPTSGVLMGGTGLGTVIASGSDDIAVGSKVMGATGWQEHALLSAAEVRVIRSDLDDALHLGVLGTNGLTAYFGLLSMGDPQPDSTVVVSAAAGSVGHIVGQLAQIRGCRVVGVAGSDQKCRLLVGELGFDAAVNRRADDFRDQFKAATPDRIGVYFDNTGGAILGSALFRMATHGRIVCCGAVSAYDTASPDPSPRGIPGLLVNNRIRMEGFLVFDFAHRYDEARAELAGWVESGQLRPRHIEFDGIESAPGAFVELLAGHTVGTTIVRF